MKDKSWHLAKIIDCRLLRDWDPKKKKNDSSYEYYVHYIDFNRRMDEWVLRSRIEMTRQLVEEDNTTKKKKKTEEKKFDNNIDDEHEGKHFSHSNFQFSNILDLFLIFLRNGCRFSACSRTSYEIQND
jgi:hypothetical protein